MSNVQLHLQEYWVKYSSSMTELNSSSKAKSKVVVYHVVTRHFWEREAQSTWRVFSVTRGGAALFPSFPSS